jgi:hypothetical protein
MVCQTGYKEFRHLAASPPGLSQQGRRKRRSPNLFDEQIARIDTAYRSANFLPAARPGKRPQGTVAVSSTMVRRDAGAPQSVLVFFPATDGERIDTWDTGGLRGTGSHDYAVHDLLVPTEHACAFDGAPRVLGLLYRLPRQALLDNAMAVIPLGIARTAVGYFDRTRRSQAAGRFGAAAGRAADDPGRSRPGRGSLPIGSGVPLRFGGRVLGCRAGQPRDRSHAIGDAATSVHARGPGSSAGG